MILSPIPNMRVQGINVRGTRIDGIGASNL